MVDQGAKGRVLDTIRQEGKGDLEGRSVAIAMNTSAKQADDLRESMGRIIKHLPKGEFKTKEAKRLKKAMASLETTITAYGHEVLPRLK